MSLFVFKPSITAIEARLSYLVVAMIRPVAMAMKARVISASATRFISALREPHSARESRDRPTPYRFLATASRALSLAGVTGRVQPS
jgi:hypothetical protein